MSESYIEHYYEPGAEMARADTLTSRKQLHDEMDRLREAGCTDVVLYPCSPDNDQVKLLADALDGAGGSAS